MQFSMKLFHISDTSANQSCGNLIERVDFKTKCENFIISMNLSRGIVSEKNFGPHVFYHKLFRQSPLTASAPWTYRIKIKTFSLSRDKFQFGFFFLCCTLVSVHFLMCRSIFSFISSLHALLGLPIITFF